LPSVTPSPVASGTRRDAQKLHTRQQLMQAALELVGQGRGFTSLSLREVTREIGVVPASFYRHFKDMDELGLALVEEGGMTLRRLLREARRSGFPPKDMRTQRRLAGDPKSHTSRRRTLCA
jgi:TetR/AcrR family transcriptional regulator, fatty acid biosynthesis regulator